MTVSLRITVLSVGVCELTWVADDVKNGFGGCSDQRSGQLRNSGAFTSPRNVERSMLHRVALAVADAKSDGMLLACAPESSSALAAAAWSFMLGQPCER